MPRACRRRSARGSRRRTTRSGGTPSSRACRAARRPRGVEHVVAGVEVHRLDDALVARRRTRTGRGTRCTSRRPAAPPACDRSRSPGRARRRGRRACGTSVAVLELRLHQAAELREVAVGAVALARAPSRVTARGTTPSSAAARVVARSTSRTSRGSSRTRVCACCGVRELERRRRQVHPLRRPRPARPARMARGARRGRRRLLRRIGAIDRVARAARGLGRDQVVDRRRDVAAVGWHAAHVRAAREVLRGARRSSGSRCSGYTIGDQSSAVSGRAGCAAHDGTRARARRRRR